MPEPTGGRSVDNREAVQKKPEVETVGSATRRYRGKFFQAILISVIGVFALLTFLAQATPYFVVDLQISRAIQTIDSPLFAGLMRLISWPGFLPQSILITLAIALLLYTYGLYWESVMSLLAALTSGAVNGLVKELIQRPRPGADLVDVIAILTSYSFPSGHVMFYTILFGFLYYLIYTLFKQSLQRSLLLNVLGVFIALVGISRIYLGQHWASDVLGAYLLGGLMLAGIILLYQWGRTRFFVRQPADSPDSS